jgi:Double zinc ribbon
MPPSNRLKNYRDLSSRDPLAPGFQYEFFCQGCDFSWRSQFKTHRVGQLTGWLTRFAFLFSDLTKAGRTTGAFADAGSRGAAEEALLAAEAQAARYFHRCPTCKAQFCEDCIDEASGQCKKCAGIARDEQSRAEAEQQRQQGAGGGGQCCPNCQAPTAGGRFCPECGFDMASTHKGCPACGSVMPRAARFCTDCGHGF